MKRLLLLSVILITGFSFGQVPTIEWEKSFGGSDNDWGHKMIMSSDSDLIIAGASQSPSIVGAGPCDSKSYIFKIDTIGNLKWELTGGTCSGSWATDLIELSSNNSILAVTGTTSDGMDTYVNIYDHNLGVQLDGVFFGNGCCQHVYPTRLVRESDSIFYVIGLSNENTGEFDTNNGLNDGWISKLELTSIPGAPGMPPQYFLNKHWIKMFGGTLNDRFISGFHHNNNIGIIGITNQESFITAPETSWFLKLDTAGNILSENSTNDLVQIENVSHFYIDGSSHVIHSGSDSYCHVRVDELNSNGQIIKSDTISINDDDRNHYFTFDAANYFDEHEKSQIINDGVDFFIVRTNDDCSSTDSDISISKLNANLNLIYDFSIGGSGLDFGGSIVGNGNTLYVLGTTESDDGDISTNNGLKDIWVVKLSSDGTSNLTELNSNQPKELIKIVNLLGQEVEYTPNTVLIYQYSDGTSEKVFTIED